jgi:hypothetical protein
MRREIAPYLTESPLGNSQGLIRRQQWMMNDQSEQKADRSFTRAAQWEKAEVSESSWAVLRDGFE